MDKTSLGDRMKNNYENISRYYLTCRMPVIVRLDGCHFHTFTKGFKKPFDNILVKTMQKAMKYLCENIQGCVLGYTQSDEISLVLTDYAELTTDAWFGNNLQKMCSVSASMVTMAFNKYFKTIIEDYCEYDPIASFEQRNKYIDACDKGAMFDSRVFTIPKEEVCNYFLWRQQDCTRNSILSVGQANFSHNELNGKSCNDIQDMLMTQKGINWNNYATTLKRGSCCIRKEQEIDTQTKVETSIIRPRWVIDNEIPIFSQDRNYIERLI